MDRDEILRKLVEIQYERNDHEFTRGTFRVRGDIVEVYPSYDDVGLRIGLFGDEIDELVSFDPLTGREVRRHERIADLSEVALRHAARAHDAGDRGDQGRADRAARRARRRGPRARGAAAAPADDVRSRDDQGDRLLPRHRELLAASVRAARRRAAADAARLPARTTRSSSSTRAIRPCRRCAGCTTAIGRARKCSSSTASGCRRRSTTGR